MEDLQQLFPHISPDRLISVLQSCDGRLEDAAGLLADDPESSNTSPDDSLETFHKPTSDVNLPADCFTVQLFNTASSSNRTKIWHATQHLPNFKTACFYDLKDGNCGPHALAMMLTFMTSTPMPTKLAEHQFVAKEIREYISDFLFLNWMKTSMIAKEPWHEIVYFSHNLAVTDEERESFPDWGNDPERRLEHWIMERDDHFYTQSDFVSFNEAMRHHGIQVVFRIWRKVRSRLIQLATIPEDAPSDQKHVVFDFAHTGKNDSSNAHWQLLKSGSVSATSGTKRTGSVDYTGMDDEEPEPKATSKAAGKRKKVR